MNKIEVNMSMLHRYTHRIGNSSPVTHVNYSNRLTPHKQTNNPRYTLIRYSNTIIIRLLFALCVSTSWFATHSWGGGFVVSHCIYKLYITVLYTRQLICIVHLIWICVCLGGDGRIASLQFSPRCHTVSTSTSSSDCASAIPSRCIGVARRRCRCRCRRRPSAHRPTHWTGPPRWPCASAAWTGHHHRRQTSSPSTCGPAAALARLLAFEERFGENRRWFFCVCVSSGGWGFVCWVDWWEVECANATTDRRKRKRKKNKTT